MSYSNVFAPMQLISIDSAAFTGAYQLITASGGLPDYAGYICFTNASNTAVTISYDGVLDHDVVRANSEKPIYFQQIALPQAGVCMVPAGQRIWVKGTASTGLFYITAYRNAVRKGAKI